MKTKPDDLVLEVGSGDKPYPRSDVLLDKFLVDSSEREAERELVIDRPFVIGDVEALPFADKSFDYIIASHVLEHAQNPGRFLDELARVGKRGYIETPLSLWERIFDLPFHRWYVVLEGKTLVLIKKTKKSQKFSSGMEASKRREFYYLEGKKLLNLKLEWEEKIKYKILPEEPDGFLKGLDKELIKFQKETSVDELVRRSAQDLKSKLLLIPGMALASKWLKDNVFRVKFEFERRLKVRERRTEIDVFSLIVCPACKGGLVLRKDGLDCRFCERRFSFYKDKIPILLL